MSAQDRIEGTDVPRTWTDEQVARGRELAAASDNCPWELGDLSLEAIAPRDAGQGDNDDARAHGKAVQAFADEIGVSHRALREYRKTARRYPFGTRVPNANWSAHRALSGNASDAPHRKVILEQLAAGKRPGQRVTADDVRRHIGTASVRRNRRDKALDVVDRFDKMYTHLCKVAADPAPLPARARGSYEVRIERVEHMLELWRDLASRGKS